MENIKENPVKAFKVSKGLSWRDLALHANLSLNFVQTLCTLTPDKCLNLSVETCLKVQEAFGIDLIEYGKSGERAKELTRAKEIV